VLLCGTAQAFQPVQYLKTSSPMLKLQTARVSLSMTSSALDEDSALRLSPLVNQIRPSKTIEVHALTKELEARGEKVTSLCVGEPDFPPPQAVLDATIAAVQDGHTRYTAVTGTANLRSAIVKDLVRRKGVEYDVSEVVVGNGAKQGVYQAILALAGPGDEVIVPTPYWPSYPEIVTMAGAKPVLVETPVEDDYLMSAAALKAAITPRTKAIVLCNPSNPTGAVTPPDLLQEYADVLSEPQAKQVWVIADEIYERLVYPGAEHKCFAALPGMRERTVIINGFSKAYAMTGYRLGYLAAPKLVASACAKLQGQITSCASSIAQSAGVAALAIPDEDLQPSFDEMQKKRDMVIEKLSEIPGIKCPTPQGAFYVLPDISSHFGKKAPDGFTIYDSDDFCMYLLREHKVALVTGSGFGAPGKVRISYATSFDELKVALSEIKQCIASLSYE